VNKREGYGAAIRKEIPAKTGDRGGVGELVEQEKKARGVPERSEENFHESSVREESSTEREVRLI